MYFKTEWDTNAGNTKGNTSGNKQGAGENPCNERKLFSKNYKGEYLWGKQWLFCNFVKALLKPRLRKNISYLWNLPQQGVVWSVYAMYWQESIMWFEVDAGFDTWLLWSNLQLCIFSVCCIIWLSI